MSKQVFIDQDECIGCQSCVEICPDVFQFNESLGKAQVLNPEGPEDLIEEAMAACPAQCIHWVG